MSQQDVRTIQDTYAAFNQQDIPAVLTAFDASIAWYETGGGQAPHGTYHGAERVVDEVFAVVGQNFDALQLETEHFIDAGEYIVVTGRVRGRAKSGQTLDTPFVHVWAMRNGKAISFHSYLDVAAWVQAWVAKHGPIYPHMRAR